MLTKQLQIVMVAASHLEIFLTGFNPSNVPSAYKLVFYLYMLCLLIPMILSAKPTILIAAMSGGPYRRPYCSPRRLCLNLFFFS